MVSWGAVWVLVALAAIVFIVETAFMVVCTAKRLRDAGLLEGELKAVTAFWLAIGWPCDVLMNLWRGSWMFREFPKWGEWTFSARVQRHYLDRGSRYWPKALHWARILNVDPGHIKEPR